MDGNRFDDLSRKLATGVSRRGALKGAAAGLLAALGLGRAADAQQVTQAQCGNVVCAGNPCACKAGCECCVYSNGNSRCLAPGNCRGGTVSACPAPTTTTTTTAAATTTTTTAPPTGCAQDCAQFGSFCCGTGCCPNGTPCCPASPGGPNEICCGGTAAEGFGCAETAGCVAPGTLGGRCGPGVAGNTTCEGATVACCSPEGGSTLEGRCRETGFTGLCPAGEQGIGP